MTFLLLCSPLLFLVGPLTLLPFPTIKDRPPLDRSIRCPPGSETSRNRSMHLTAFLKHTYPLAFFIGNLKI